MNDQAIWSTQYNIDAKHSEQIETNVFDYTSCNCCKYGRL